MPILNYRANFPGQQMNPRFCHLHSNDTLAVCTAAGYLNPYIQSQGLDVNVADFIFVSALDGHQVYKPVFGANGVVTLTALP